MSLSRRSFASFGKILAAAALVATGLQPAVPQARGKGAQASRVTGPSALRGQEITFTSPQFVVHALWFKANDETNWAWQGSDEVYAVFSDLQPDHADFVTSTYGNVDEGDLVNFSDRDRCVAPTGRVGSPWPHTGCQGGLAELNVRYSFWEQDGPYPLGLEFCPGSFPGDHHTLQNGKCDSDDLIGWGAIVHNRDELVAMLPAVGDSREFTHVMDKDAGKYRFRYRITRLADAERSIVIHFPPDLGQNPTPTITLQAAEVQTPQGRRVRLTWTGATTTSVTVNRNANSFTTPNDGTHDDQVPDGTYQYRVCNAGSTTVCSPQVSITLT